MEPSEWPWNWDERDTPFVPSSPKFIDITGQKFNSLTAVHPTRQVGHCRTLWMFKCDCGSTIEAHGSTVRYGKKVSCGCHRPAPDLDTTHVVGYADIRSRYFRRAYRGAIERGLKFSITAEYAWEIFLAQNKKCALSNVPIVLSYRTEDQTASLDRIDSSGGYIEGNIQWVHKDVNRMKSDFVQAHFIELCKAIAAHNN